MNYKKYFPIFEKNPDLVYLDSGATTLKPKKVLDKMMEYYTDYSANIHRGLYPISERATEEYEAVRGKVARFIGAKNKAEIIFTGGTTASLNMVAIGWGNNNIRSGDEILVTEMEHHSNLIPWQQLAKRKGAILKYIKVGSDYRLGLNDLEMLITSKTKILAITQVSNVLGTVNPVKEIVNRAKKINPKITVVVDGAQAVAHMPVDVTDMDADFYAFSGHKMYGPTGVGVLWAKTERLQEMEPASFGGGMISDVEMDTAVWSEGPDKYEAGTPPIAEVIGLGAAIDFVRQFDWKEIAGQEKELTKYTLESLKKIEGMEILGPGSDNDRTGVISFVLNSVIGSPHDVGDILGNRFGVCVRAGLHCAIPLHKKFEAETGTTRISLATYNTKEDIDKLVIGLKGVLETLKK
jgi:cysteine desulfurase / selenocysteine lyase